MIRALQQLQEFIRLFSVPILNLYPPTDCIAHSYPEQSMCKKRFPCFPVILLPFSLNLSLLIIGLS